MCTLRQTPVTWRIKNIYVPLETVNAHDFNGQYSDILTDSRFRIDIGDCAAGTKIDYQFTSAGSTGVTDGNILNIATETTLQAA